MAQQGTQHTKRRKGMVSTILLIIAAFLLLFLLGYLARIFGDDSEGKYKYCTVEKAWAEYRAGGDLSGNTDYTRVGWLETRECGKLALSESPNKDQSMDDYMASIEPGGYYKVYLKNVQLGSPGLTSVTRLEKAERPS